MAAPKSETTTSLEKTPVRKEASLRETAVLTRAPEAFWALRVRMGMTSSSS
jgi:hypothetical protein